MMAVPQVNTFTVSMYIQRKLRRWQVGVKVVCLVLLGSTFLLVLMLINSYFNPEVSAVSFLIIKNIFDQRAPDARLKLFNFP